MMLALLNPRRGRRLVGRDDGGRLRGLRRPALTSRGCRMGAVTMLHTPEVLAAPAVNGRHVASKAAADVLAIAAYAIADAPERLAPRLGHRAVAAAVKKADMVLELVAKGVGRLTAIPRRPDRRSAPRLSASGCLPNRRASFFNADPMRVLLSAALFASMLSLVACGEDTPAPQAPPPTPPPPLAIAAATPASPPADTTPPPPAPKPSMADMIATATKAEVDAINAHDAQKFASLFAADGVRRFVGTPPPDEVGRDAIVASLQHAFATLPDFKLAISRMWIKDNVRITTEDWNATDSGAGYHGAKPTGRPVGVTAATVAVFGDDGLIKELRIYGDGVTLMKQLDPKAKPDTFRVPPALAVSYETIVAGGPSEDANLQTTKAMWQSWDDHRNDAVMGYYAPGATGDFNATMKTKDVTAMKKSNAMEWSAFPDLKGPCSAMWAIGDYTICEGVDTGTFKNNLGPYKANGKIVTTHYVDILQWKDGKIVRDQLFANGFEFLTQIGALKPPPEATPRPNQ